MILLLAACSSMAAPPAPSPPPAAAGEQRVLVPVLARDVPAGSAIGAADVQWVWLPPDYVPSSVLKPADPLLGRVASERLLKHEFFRNERLAPQPAGSPVPAADLPTAPSRPASTGPDTVMVLVAALDLPQGHVIADTELYAVQIPPAYLPEGVFLSPQHVVGRKVCDHVLVNEFVRAERLCP